MSQQELLRKVIEALGDAGIEYMLTGSVVSSLQGEPRSTHDIDMVVAIERAAVKRLVKAFPSPDFYLDEESIIDAINNQGMFNLMDVNAGDKVDRLAPRARSAAARQNARPSGRGGFTYSS